MSTVRADMIRGVIHNVMEDFSTDGNFSNYDGEKALPPTTVGQINTGELYKGGSDYDLDNDTQTSLVKGALPIKAIDPIDDVANNVVERIMSFMPNSSAMSVKKKCQIGGNGDGTSTACNQGDISNIELKSIHEDKNRWHKMLKRKWDEVGDGRDLSFDEMEKELRKLKAISVTEKEVNEIIEYEKSKKGFTLQEMINEAIKISINDLPFKNDIEKAGGKIFSVGGAVRDAMIGKESKDLDLLVTGLPLERLESLLMKYGKVDNVGKSFGIIKFNSPQTGELDIAIPRTERKNSQGGYQGFDVTSDHNLPIEKDLERRDFTINAIAKDSNGNTVDPYGGELDIKNKIIRMVNPQAFSDDPLRMIRAVQFAARFGFTIEPKTFEAIQANASKIQEISPERILIEFDKIVKKGNPSIGAELLIETGLFGWIFENNSTEPNVNFAELKKVKTMGEFIFILGSGNVPYDSVSDFYKTKLKGDLDTYNEIRAYELAYGDQSNNPVQNKMTVFAMNKTSPVSLQSAILPDNIKSAISEMKSMGMPFSLKELQVNGNDLLAMGYSGQQIGQILKNLLIDVYSGKVRNNNQLLLRQILPVDQNPTKNK